MPAPKPEQAASRLLKSHRIAATPIPVEQLAEKLGAQVVREPLRGDVSGMLFREDDRIVIGVNSAEAPVRQRFTIAHELGHLQLHPGKPVIIDKLLRVNLRETRRTSMSDRQEREANQFAAALLMPQEWVKEAAQDLLDDRGPRDEAQLVERLAH